jgi:hypothetical protein
MYRKEGGDGDGWRWMDGWKNWLMHLLRINLGKHGCRVSWSIDADSANSDDDESHPFISPSPIILSNIPSTHTHTPQCLCSPTKPVAQPAAQKTETGSTHRPKRAPSNSNCWMISRNSVRRIFCSLCSSTDVLTLHSLDKS